MTSDFGEVLISALWAAQFDIVRVDHERRIVLLADRNQGHRSVTNDAERVVRWVNALHPGYRIVYRDTMGRWDELVHDDGVFVEFRAGPWWQDEQFGVAWPT